MNKKQEQNCFVVCTTFNCQQEGQVDISFYNRSCLQNKNKNSQNHPAAQRVEMCTEMCSCHR